MQRHRQLKSSRITMPHCRRDVNPVRSRIALEKNIFLKPGPGLATVVIYSPHDNFVMPQANLRLPAAVDRPLDGIGHLAMLFSPRVADTLLAVLAPIADISKRASSA